MRHWLQIIRKKLFGGHSDVEIAEERQSWREKVHKSRNDAQRSIATAVRQGKASDKAFLVAEEVARMFAENVEKQKQIQEKLEHPDEMKKKKQ
jgi:hypothetical protein